MTDETSNITPPENDATSAAPDDQEQGGYRPYPSARTYPRPQHTQEFSSQPTQPDSGYYASASQAPGAQQVPGGQYGYQSQTAQPQNAYNPYGAPQGYAAQGSPYYSAQTQEAYNQNYAAAQSAQEEQRRAEKERKRQEKQQEKDRRRQQRQREKERRQQQKQQQGQPGDKKNSTGKTFLVAFAGALVACVLAFGVMGVVNSMTDDSDGTATPALGTSYGGQQTTINVTEDDATLAEAVSSKCLPSVVAIDVYAKQQQEMSLEELILGYGYGYGNQGDDGELALYSQGSGVVLTDDGYIITNNHVIEDGEAYEVTIEGETYEAELVGSDPSSDVAVLKAKDASGLTAMEIGDSDDLTIGEWVMTIGSPFGLEQSVATGIVSATSRSQIMDSSEYGTTGEVTIYPNMIQTDAAINPGNSGGALVDSEGKLIGLNTLITSYSGNYSGVGFAIPVNYAVNIAQQIISGETPTHAQLGVSLSTVDSQTAQRYGLAVESGAYVASVSAGSGAAEAGIVPGDIITAFDGEEVESASDLMLDVRTKNPGDTVTLTVSSNGETRDVQVTLGDDSASQKESSTQQESSGRSRLDELFGYGSGGSQSDAA